MSLLVAFISEYSGAWIDLPSLAGGVGRAETFTLFNLFGAGFDVLSLLLQMCWCVKSV